MHFRHAWVLLLVAAACQKGPGGGSRSAIGTERGDCRPDKTCEPGLLCLSNLCVAPPPADCTAVADALASLELGNYAEVEQRQPVVAKYKASCETARVSKEEGACLDKVRDKWSAAQCVPRMFPELKSDGSDCGKVSDKIRALLAKQMANQNQNPQMQAMYETTMRVMRESCEQDTWPKPFIACVLAANADSDLGGCNEQLPKSLQDKMSERLQAAIRQQPSP